MSSNSDNSDLARHFDDLSDQVQELFNFREDASGKTKNTTSLAAKLAIGAEYKVPVYEKLSFGFLFTHSFQKHHSWSEGRFSANLTPVSWFDAAVSAAFSTYGTSMGWLVNFHPKGFNLFLGSDFMIFKVTPQFIPLHNNNAHISLAISFPFVNKR